MARQFVCPVCFERHPISDWWKHCAHAQDEEAEEEGQGRRQKSLKKKVHRPKVQIRLPFLCFRSGERSHILECRQTYRDEHGRMQVCHAGVDYVQCPACHNAQEPCEGDREDNSDTHLPPELLLCDSSYIAVIGLPAAGKSHFMASLITELRRKSANYGCGLYSLEDRTEQLYRAKYWNPLYERHALLDATPEYTPGDAQRPLLYQFEIGAPHSAKNLMFLFYDSAGEDFSKDNVADMVNFCRYLKYASGAIVLVDPLQLEPVQNSDKMKEYLDCFPAPKSRRQTADILKVIAQCLPCDRKGRVSIPVAVTFSKIDAVRSLFSVDSPIYRSMEVRGDRRVNRWENERIHEEMEEMLKAYEGNDRILETVAEAYPRHHYFGVSALGDNRISTKERGSLTGDPEPYRCIQPLLWILAQQGLLREK